MKATWEEIKNQIKLELPENSFSLWINPIDFFEKKDGTVILACPNKFSRNWVTENYSVIIQDKLDKMLPGHVDLVFKVETPQRKPPQSRHAPDHHQLVFPNLPRNGRPARPSFNRGFTFDRFIVGRSNEFAYSASNALAHGDPCNYQTLLMLGKTGLGKTHLAQAVGNTVLDENPQARVYYITAEDFTNEMVFSLRNNCIEQFKNKYRRGCDVLLLEEIHFLSGKKKTQLELGYTLDALGNDNKKILFTSSLPPKDIPHMSGKLSSRLTSGLVTTIAGPDYDTRVKILEKKVSEHNISLSQDIIQFLASRLIRDIRQMESALKYLKAKSELLKAKINLDLAKDVVSCLVSEGKSVTAEEIKKLVSKYYKLDPDVLRSKSRKKLHAYPRNIYVYLCRHHTDETLESIAKTINRSHSTALYASELVEHKMRTDSKMMNQIKFLNQRVDDLKR